MRSLEPHDPGKSGRDDLIGLLGGAGCLVLSELDPGWGKFWLAAGVILIVWSLVSMYRRRSRA